MNPVKINGGEFADFTVVAVAPAVPGLFVLQASSLPEDEIDESLGQHPVLGWAFEAGSLIPHPIASGGVINGDYCVFDACGVIHAQHGCDDCTATVNEWIDEMRAIQRERQAMPKQLRGVAK